MPRPGSISRRPRPLLALTERLLAALQRRDRSRTDDQRQGAEGERAALFYLRRQGYLIVARRWTDAMTEGEIDLLGWEGETLCFIEVKTRGSRTPFAAEFAIGRDKQEAMRRMATAYVRQMPFARGERPQVAMRFDAVSVYLEPGETADVRLLRDYFR